jgi:membrane-bound lytic murein transglycosylase F
MEILKGQYPQVNWNAYYDRDIDALLRMVQYREIKSAVADARQVNIYKHLYPDIRVAFDITKPQPVAWLYRDDEICIWPSLNFSKNWKKPEN